MAKMSARRGYYNNMAAYTGRWEVEMCDAPCAQPGVCCYSAWCAPCQSFHLRARVLRNDFTQYRCCGGFHPCASRYDGPSNCPQLLLCCEAYCCFATSVMSTRFMIQREMQIGNSSCDDNLICLVIGCEWAACIASILDEGAGQLFHTLADGVYLSVCACMQTQHAVQLDARDSGARVTFAPVAVPPQQVMLMPVAQQPVQYYAPPMQQQQVFYTASVSPPVMQSFDGGKPQQQAINPMYAAAAAAPGPMSPAAALSQWLADNRVAEAEEAVVRAGATCVADLSSLGEADLLALDLPKPLYKALSLAVSHIPKTIPK